VNEIEIEESAPRYFNRELSWLQFNARVLARIDDQSLPLLERLKFCSIYASNLDEFFMVRVAGLKDLVAAGISSASPDGLSPLSQLAAIRDIVEAQTYRLQKLLDRDVLPSLADEGVVISPWGQLGEADAKRAAVEFEDRIFPILTPLAVDPAHPFPYISSLSLNIAVLARDPATGENRFARIKVPSSLPRFVSLPDNRFVAAEEVIIAHLDQLFHGMEVLGGWTFRVTRNADLAFDEDAEDLLEAVEMELRRRRFGRAIRLEVGHDMPNEVLDLLRRELDLDDVDVFGFGGLLDASDYSELLSIDRDDLKLPATPGATPMGLRELEGAPDLFRRIANADIFLHHPYDSFGASVTEFVRQASLDRDVLAIKITLYRTSGDSPIVNALIGAAERGKQVAALVELKARFDEQANIAWARRLEEAGVHVVYGLVGLKIHTKTALVVRDEPSGVRRYCHIGTGNYNPKTAKVYEDVGVLPADPAVGEDLSQLFNFLTGYGRNVDYQRLLVAPSSLRDPLETLIANEIECHRAFVAGAESRSSDKQTSAGHIILKMNNLVDSRIIDLLYEASGAGVIVELIIRGICCLVPGVPSQSENITVRSLVGKNLEHSRIFYFKNGGALDSTPQPGAFQPETDDEPSQAGERYFIGSADLMPRNLDRRVEALLRIDDRASKRRLEEILATCLSDEALSWILEPTGIYSRSAGTANAQQTFELLAKSRSGSALEISEPSISKTDKLLQFLPRRRS